MATDNATAGAAAEPRRIPRLTRSGLRAWARWHAHLTVRDVVQWLRREGQFPVIRGGRTLVAQRGGRHD